MLKNTFRLIPFNSVHTADAVRVWNAASHANYPINERLFAYNIIPTTGEIIEGRVAVHHEETVGFVLACAMLNDQSMGCKRIRLGGNLRPFLPGLPSVMCENAIFFEKHGYQSPPHQPYEYDIARSLKDYQSIYPKPAYAELAPMQSGEEQLLLNFLHCEYPGRWEFEAREFIKNGGRASDFLLLRVSGEVHGFCRITLEDSERPIERFYPQRLSPPWGQFGPLGLSRAVRGQGLGGYLIDSAALHMQLLGVNGCVIDWTSLVELYGKFGFRVYNQYVSLFKRISEE